MLVVRQARATLSIIIKPSLATGQQLGIGEIGIIRINNKFSLNSRQKQLTSTTSGDNFSPNTTIWLQLCPRAQLSCLFSYPGEDQVALVKRTTVLVAVVDEDFVEEPLNVEKGCFVMKSGGEQGGRGATW